MTSGNELNPTASGPVATRSTAARRAGAPRWSRRRGVAGVFAGGAAVLMALAYIGPMGAALSPAEATDAREVSLWSDSVGDAQSFHAASEATAAGLDRDGAVYTVYVTPKPTPTPTPTPTPVRRGAVASAGVWSPPAVSPNPGSAQAVAYDMVLARGWSANDFACLVSLWNKESGWRVNAQNRSSGAYGIPQALPGAKMASAGADWATNPATQIAWGLGYIGARYGTPCGAWGHSQTRGWY